MKSFSIPVFLIRVLKRNLHLIIFSSLVFILSGLIGISVFSYYPPLRPGNQDESSEIAYLLNLSVTDILVQNLSVAIVCFLGSISFGITTFFVLSTNGVFFFHLIGLSAPLKVVA